METLQAVLDRVISKSAIKRDYTTTLAQFVTAMSDFGHVQTNDGELVLTPGGFRQLINDRLRYKTTAFEHEALRPETKFAILRDLAAEQNDEILVRVSGNQIDSVLSADYAMFDNHRILESLQWLMDNEYLPSDVQVMQHFINPNARRMSLRLISPSNWDFFIKERNGDQPFRGNFLVSNNELGDGAFKAQVALTRNSCLNSTIGESLFKVEHRGGRFGNREEFLDALVKAAMLVRDYSKRMVDQMSDLQSIKLQNPVLVFERIGEELGVPQYGLSGARDYYTQNQGDSLYDAVQAVSAGVRAVAPTPIERIELRDYSRSGNPDKRLDYEARLWELAQSLRNMQVEGNSIDEHYMREGDLVRERAAKYVEGYAQVDEHAPAIAEGIREMVL